MTAIMDESESLEEAVLDHELELPSRYGANFIHGEITVAPSLNLGCKSPKSPGVVRGTTAERRRSGTAPPGFRAGIPPSLLELLEACPITQGRGVPVPEPLGGMVAASA